MDIYGVSFAWNVCVRLVFASLLYLVFCAATHREQLLCLLKQPRVIAHISGKMCIRDRAMQKRCSSPPESSCG